MAKKATAFELMLPLRDSTMPAYRWLYEGLRRKILEGRLRPGARIPGTRDLANTFGLSRGTIVYAFDQLKAEGYLEGTVGSGTYVSKVLPEELLHVGHDLAGESRRAQRKQHPRISDYGMRVKLFSGYELRPSHAFRANLPALDLFPATTWANFTARRLRNVSTYLLMGTDPMGYLPLREAITDYLIASRGVKCTPDQVMIVSGVQEALDLAARLLLNPGDRVCIEDPGYTGAAITFESVGAKLTALPVDQEGMILTYSKMRQSRLLYITPSHQFPLGVTMSLRRRLELLEWAYKSDALIMEDDYDSEFRYLGHPIPSLQGLDRNGLVLFAGSFSKVLFPSLRLGYLVIPRDLIERFAAAKSITSRHASLLDQAVLCDFITQGHFGRHIRRMREIYAERLSVLLDSAKQRLAGLLEISNVEAGLQTAGWLAEGITANSAEQAAALRNVEVTPLNRYSRRRMSREGLQLGFAPFDAKEIRRGVRELAIALEEL